MRVIYDQDLSAHAFSSLVAFTSIVGSGSVSNGNSRLVEALFDHSKARVYLNTTLTRVSRKQNDGGFVIESTRDGVSEIRQTDRIVLATPFEYSSIDFGNITMKEPEP